VQHIEFFDIDHFENYYYRTKPSEDLNHFIDFFWETRFEDLLRENPQGFSDTLFPNIGYTYLINLGTPFIMQVDEKSFERRSDGFLPRNKSIECFHSAGNHLFGIKFKVSPVIFEKRINFSEYREYIFPLSYLLDQHIINEIKKATDFNERVIVLTSYFQKIVQKYHGSLRPIQIVTEILEQCNATNNFTTPIQSFASKYNISTRTLQRYFEITTSISSKQALQILRIRKATNDLATSPDSFNFSLYGYYDKSHFYKHLKNFLQKSTLQNLKPHLKLLGGLHS
jgi:AraC-like DNA-binding protein